MNQLISTIAIFSTLISWALTLFYNKKIMKDISPVELSLNRWIIGGGLGISLLFLGSLTSIKELEYDYEKNQKHLPLIGLMLVGSLIGSICYYYLLDKYGASTVSMYVNPLHILVVALMGHFFFNERFNPQMWIGMFTIVLGMLIFTHGKQS